jgi:hypothetical protein
VLSWLRTPLITMSCAPSGVAVTTAGLMIRRTDDTVRSLVFGTLP